MAAGVQVPNWVLSYLDRVAETMHVLNINPPAKAASRQLRLAR